MYVTTPPTLEALKESKETSLAEHLACSALCTSNVYIGTLSHSYLPGFPGVFRTIVAQRSGHLDEISEVPDQAYKTKYVLWQLVNLR